MISVEKHLRFNNRDETSALTARRVLCQSNCIGIDSKITRESGTNPEY